MPGYLTPEESAHFDRLAKEAAAIVVPYADRPWRDLTGEEVAERADAEARKRCSLVTIIPPGDPAISRIMAEFDEVERERREGPPGDRGGRLAT